MKADAVFESLTSTFIKRIEDGLTGKWEKPWLDLGEGIATNAETNNRYQGGNILLTLVAAYEAGYSGPYWATYKQWANIGGQVKKGERGTRLLFWKTVERVNSDGEQVVIPFANSFTVFHADQQEGWVRPEPPVMNSIERVEEADRFFESVGARVVEGGDRACYSPEEDYIRVPKATQFKDVEGFYSTLAHEYAHWTGHKSRLNRFGDGAEAYAMEELVAELTAAFVCSTLSITASPRDDHVAYLSHWLKALKEDPKALWRAASQATQAHNYLSQLADTQINKEEIA